MCVYRLSSVFASKKDMTNTAFPLPANLLLLYFIVSIASEKAACIWLSLIVCKWFGNIKYWLFCQSKVTSLLCDWFISYVLLYLVYWVSYNIKARYYDIDLDDCRSFPPLVIGFLSDVYTQIFMFSSGSFSLSLTELNQTQSVLAQSFCARPEWRNGEELMVDAEPWGGKEWQVSTPESHFHGQQQQVHKEPWTSSQEKGQLRGKKSLLAH